MKKILFILIIASFTATIGFCSEFEDALFKAEQGDAQSQCLIGVMYSQGKDVPQDFKKATEWYNVLKKMTPVQIDEAQELSRQLYNKIYNS